MSRFYGKIILSKNIRLLFTSVHFFYRVENQLNKLTVFVPADSTGKLFTAFTVAVAPNPFRNTFVLLFVPASVVLLNGGKA